VRAIAQRNGGPPPGGAEKHAERAPGRSAGSQRGGARSSPAARRKGILIGAWPAARCEGLRPIQKRIEQEHQRTDGKGPGSLRRGGESGLWARAGNRRPSPSRCRLLPAPTRGIRPTGSARVDRRPMHGCPRLKANMERARCAQTCAGGPEDGSRTQRPAGRSRGQRAGTTALPRAT